MVSIGWGPKGEKEYEQKAGRKMLVKLTPSSSLKKETRCQFHQHSTYSFYACRSRKHKKLTVSFTRLGSVRIKAVRRTLMKLSPVDHSDFYFYGQQRNLTVISNF